MKFKFIAAAAAACCAQTAFADAAYDAAIAKINQAVASGKVLRMAGASAMTASIRGAVAKTCVGDKIDAAFIAGAGTAASLGNYYVYVCTAKDLATTNFASNPFFTSGANNAQVVVVAHEGAATSLQAADGSIAMTLLNLPTVSACNPTAIAVGSLSTTVNNLYNGCTAAAQAGAIGGFSDVEKALFQNVIDSGGLVLPNEANISATPSFGSQAFSVIASRPLYRALQAAQGITDADCLNDTAVSNATGTGATTTVGVNDFTTPKCQPSISRSQYSTAVAVGNTEALGLSTNPWATFGLGGTKNMRIARRVDLSGTQASSNAYFLGTNCASGPAGGQNFPSGSGTAGTVTYPNASGKLIVTTDTGTSGVLAKVNAGFGSGNVGTANDYVMGVVSSENALRATDSFGYLKINGVSPTADAKQRQTAIDGNYELQFEFILHTNESNGTQLQRDYITMLNDLIGGDPSDANAPDLTGVWTLPLGFSNADFPTRVSKGFRGGNNCAPVTNAL